MDSKKLRNLLKSTNVTFYLGAGASVVKKMGQISFPLMSDLLNAVKNYLDKNKIEDLGTFNPFVDFILSMLYKNDCNIEDFLSKLIGFSSFVYDDVQKQKYQIITQKILDVIIQRVQNSNKNEILPIYKQFYSALKHFFVNNKTAFNVFTTNYDLLSEEALDSIGMHYYSGFHGTVIKKFVPQYFNSNYVDYFGVNGTNFQINQQHVNLYKLHGSLSWHSKVVDGEKMVVEEIFDDHEPVVVYPSVNKYDDTNEVVVFTTLLRLFSQKIANGKTTLVVIGSSLNDEHINKLIENALLDVTFTLVLFPFSKEEKKRFKTKFENQRNVFIYSEEGITLEKFVEIIKPSDSEGKANES